ncbi:plastocyanin/azurin family copper-binding protein [Streptomyces sp. NPDC005492]|uniref:cupredoxin domain-containing protein n=1 Tax=Streptomyces sp. NPDC005492 TaxID=3156883 RepID=UPI0033A99BE6
MRAAGRATLAAVLAPLALLGLSALLVLPAGQASAASYHVLMKGYAFSPAALTITAGTTVTWTNEDTAPHDVKTTSGPVAIHSPMLSKGQSWSFTFTTAGSYGYVCTVHPGMTAQVAVKPVAAPTSVAPTKHEQQHTTAPSRTATVRTPSHTSSSPPPPTMSMPASSPTPAAAAAAPASPTAAPQTGQVQQAASTSRPLDPLLVLAGLVAGVAVLCLLLVGSRAQASGGETRG